MSVTVSVGFFMWLKTRALGLLFTFHLWYSSAIVPSQLPWPWVVLGSFLLLCACYRPLPSPVVRLRLGTEIGYVPCSRWKVQLCLVWGGTFWFFYQLEPKLRTILSVSGAQRSSSARPLPLEFLFLLWLGDSVHLNLVLHLLSSFVFMERAKCRWLSENLLSSFD